MRNIHGTEGVKGIQASEKETFFFNLHTKCDSVLNFLNSSRPKDETNF